MVFVSSPSSSAFSFLPRTAFGIYIFFYFIPSEGIQDFLTTSPLAIRRSKTLQQMKKFGHGNLWVNVEQFPGFCNCTDG